MEEFKKIVDWFKSQCDGDWEHENNIKLFTTDSPGWGLLIDISNTNIEGIKINYSNYQNSLNWIKINSNGHKFEGYASIDSLENLFLIFINNFIKKSNNNFFYEIYGLFDEEFKVYNKYEARLLNENEFEIVSVPPIKYNELKFNDFENINEFSLSNHNFKARYKIGDIVKCDLFLFADTMANKIINN